MSACKTPGAVYSFAINGSDVSMTMRLPADLSTKHAKALERDLHDAMEAAVAPYFVEQKPRKRGNCAKCGGSGRVTHHRTIGDGRSGYRAGPDTEGDCFLCYGRGSTTKRRNEKYQAGDYS